MRLIFQENSCFHMVLTGNRINKCEVLLLLNFIFQSLTVGVKFVSFPKPKENPWTVKCCYQFLGASQKCFSSSSCFKYLNRGLLSGYLIFWEFRKGGDRKFHFVFQLLGERAQFLRLGLDFSPYSCVWEIDNDRGVIVVLAFPLWILNSTFCVVLGQIINKLNINK